MKSVYISGPMTGLPDLNFPAFHVASETVRAQGYNAVNPAEINPDPKTGWQQCMRNDIKALCDCDALLLLPGWQHSQGAQLEQSIAHRIGIKIFVGEMPPLEKF